MSVRCYSHSVNPEKSTSYVHISKSTSKRFIARGTHHAIRQGIQEYSPAEKTIRMQEARRIEDMHKALALPWYPAEIPCCRFVGPKNASEIPHLVRTVRVLTSL